MIKWFNATTMQALLIKFAMLAVAVALVLWIGWPMPKEPDTDQPPSMPHEQIAGPQGPTERVFVSDQEPSGRAITDTKGPSQTGITLSITGAKRLDINRATVEELQALPGIGEVLARRVVERRTARGSFNTVEDLLEVKGIGEKRLNRLRPLIHVGHLTKASSVTIKPGEALALQEKGGL